MSEDNAENRVKCDGEALKFCNLMEERIAGYASAVGVGRGFVRVVVGSPGGGRRELGLAYRMTARDGGMMLNFCPFCGERIDEKFNADDASRKGDRSS